MLDFQLIMGTVYGVKIDFMQKVKMDQISPWRFDFKQKSENEPDRPPDIYLLLAPNYLLRLKTHFLMTCHKWFQPTDAHFGSFTSACSLGWRTSFETCWDQAWWNSSFSWFLSSSMTARATRWKREMATSVARNWRRCTLTWVLSSVNSGLWGSCSAFSSWTTLRSASYLSSSCFRQVGRTSWLRFIQSCRGT